MSQSIESYGNRPLRDAGWGESDDGTSGIVRPARSFVRYLDDHEEPPCEHPRAADGWRYEIVVEDDGPRVIDGRREVDAAARAATEALACGDVALWYLLAQQWAMHEHGAPLPAGSGYREESQRLVDDEAFVPGRIEDGVFVYDCAFDGCCYEAAIDDQLRLAAREWADGTAPLPRRRLVEVLGRVSR